MTADRDDLDDLKAAMQAATPAPDPAKRAENMARAAENFAALQGSRTEARPTPATGRSGLMTGVRQMLTTLTSRGGLAMTTAIVACGVLFLSPAGRNIWQPPAPGGLTVAPPQEAAPVALDEADLAVDTAEEAPMAEPVPVIPQAVQPVTSGGTSASHPRSEPRATSRSVGLSEAAPALRATPAPAASGGPGADAEAGFLLDGPVVERPIPLPAEADTEAFPEADANPVKVTAEEPVSTFSIDVDTASYAVIRSSLMRGQLPPRDAVRIEEMINYFPYDYPAPDAGEAPFRPTISIFETPWNPDTEIVHIALQGQLPAIADRPPLNLVFLIDTSGSMDDPAKLPLLKQSFRLMLGNLAPEDEVAIVAYAGSAGQVLAPTPASDRAAILAALDALGAGGSTNGQGGLEQAYTVAEGMAEDGEVSRVILATDGDFNVGLSDPARLTDFIAEKRDSGTYLSVLGFGRGNLDDATMQALAQNGNGTAAHIDTLSEAQKVLVDQLTGALFPIADDVKVQIEFNPAVIAEYRLIGYETRALRREDFNNDRVDAGEFGAGHSVTAIYEVTPVGSPAVLNDPLRYETETPVAGESDELGFLRLRYKAPGEDVSHLIEAPITGGGTPGGEALFAAAIAGFGQLLTGATYLGDWGWDEAIALANANRGEDAFGYRTEAVQLMRLAESLAE